MAVMGRFSHMGLPVVERLTQCRFSSLTFFFFLCYFFLVIFPLEFFGDISSLVIFLCYGRMKVG